MNGKTASPVSPYLLGGAACFWLVELVLLHELGSSAMGFLGQFWMLLLVNLF